MSNTAALLFTSFICATSGTSENAKFQGTVASTPEGEVRQTSVVRKDVRLEVETNTIATKWTLRAAEDGIITLYDSNDMALITFRRDPDSQMATANDGENVYRCFLDREASYFADTRQNFCDSGKAPANLTRRLANPANRLAFPNGPYGLMDGGVCWWISKFERNALYLARFSPEKPKPNVDQAKKLISQIREAKQIVDIPGFKTLREFSAAFKPQIVSSLEDWQFWDGVLGFGWIHGVSGSTSVAPKELLATMNNTFKIVETDKLPAYHMIQMPGVTAHSWLVIGMEVSKDSEGQANGYNLMVADSNFNELAVWHEYRHGMRQLPFYQGVPYLKSGVQKETKAALSKRQAFCSSQQSFLQF